MNLLMIVNVFLWAFLTTEQNSIFLPADAEGLMFRPVLTYHITTVAQSSEI